MSYGVLNRPVQVLQITRDPETGSDTIQILSDSPNALSSIEDDGEVEI